MKELPARLRRRLGEIHPAAPRGPVDRGRTYGWALIGVALLTVLTWCTDASRFAAGFFVASVLAVLWIAWTAHRAFVTTALALAWWFLTAPTVGTIAATGLPAPEAVLAVSPATATVGLLGVVVGLVAVLSRAPRPALTVATAWVTDTAAIVIGSYLVPTSAWTIGYVLTVGVLIWRTGFRVRSRNRGRPDGVPEYLYDLLTAVPGGVVGVVAGRRGRAVTVLVGPSGTYSVTPITDEGTVRATLRGTRLLINGGTLPNVRTAQRAGKAATDALRTPVQPVLVLLAADFGDGLARVTTDAGTGVLVVRGDLLASRLSYGSPVLTGGQIRRLARRLAKAAKPEKAEKAEKAEEPADDESGAKPESRATQAAGAGSRTRKRRASSASRPAS